MKGLSFSERMVLASLAGSKRVTRRVRTGRKVHYGEPGDLLYMREAHYIDLLGEMDQPVSVEVEYDAGRNPQSRLFPWDQVPPDVQTKLTLSLGKTVNTDTLRPAMFMFRCFSRAVIQIVRTFEQPIQEISCVDIRMEGVDCPVHDIPGRIKFCVGECPDLRAAFIELWDRINAGRGYPYSSNPMVTAIEYDCWELPEQVTGKRYEV